MGGSYQEHWGRCSKRICGSVSIWIDPGPRLNLRYWPAVEDDEEQGNNVHDGKHAHHDVLTVDIMLPSRCDTDQLESNTQFDGNDCNAVKDFEKKEPLHSLAAGLQDRSECFYFETEALVFCQVWITESPLVNANTIEGRP